MMLKQMLKTPWEVEEYIRPGDTLFIRTSSLPQAQLEEYLEKTGAAKFQLHKLECLVLEMEKVTTFSRDSKNTELRVTCSNKDIAEPFVLVWQAKPHLDPLAWTEVKYETLPLLG